MEFGPGDPVLGGEHASGCPKGAFLLGRCTGHDAGIVGEENGREMEAAHDFKEAGAFLGGCAIKGASAMTRIIGHDGDRAPSKAGEGRNQRPSEMRLDFEDTVLIRQ